MYKKREILATLLLVFCGCRVVNGRMYSGHFHIFTRNITFEIRDSLRSGRLILSVQRDSGLWTIRYTKYNYPSMNVKQNRTNDIQVNKYAKTFSPLCGPI